MRIRFLSEQIYESSPGVGPRFPAGFVLDTAGVQAALGLDDEPTAEWSDGFLGRWLRREVAEEVGDDVPVSKPGGPLDHDGNGKKGGAKQPDVEQIEKLDLTTLTRAELDALAAKRGVDISEAKNKADVIAALDLAEEFNGHDV